MSSLSTSRIVELAQRIASQTVVIDEHLHKHDLPQPSFEVDGPMEPIQKETADIKQARTDVVEATIELRQLLEGPVKSVLPETNFSPLASIHRFKIATFVPLEGSISFAELSSKCGVLEHALQQIVRYAIVYHRIFHEPKPGHVAHTAASKILTDQGPPFINDLVGLAFDECWPAQARTPDALALQTTSPTQTGYTLANSSRTKTGTGATTDTGTELTTFEYLSLEPERAARFARCMSSTSEASLNALASYFDWNSLAPNSTVVDIGGSRGHVSVYLARKFPHLKFVVQDLPEVVTPSGADLSGNGGGDSSGDIVPPDVKDRVQLQVYNMLTTPQPQDNDADVYLLRYVLHDWPDEYCVRILGNIASAVKRKQKGKKVRVIIQDHLLPDEGTKVGLLEEMRLRGMDAIMLSLFNSRERGKEDWKTLFEDVNSSLALGDGDGGEGKFDVEGFQAKRVKENPVTGVMIAEWV